MMKTPDEIKKGLETCIGECTGNKPHCPYHECGNGCMDSMNRGALAYIQQLESRLAQAERERDAAVADLKIVRCCGTCANNEGGCTTECYIVSGTLTGWKWRGLPENTKEEAK